MKLRLLVTVLTIGALALTSSHTLYGETGPAMEKTAASAPAGAPAAPAVTAGSVRAAQNRQLALDFNPQTAEIAVTDVTSGIVWRSNPEDRANDAVARGVKKMDLNAQLLVDYIDPLIKPNQLNSFIGSVQDKSFTWKQIQDGIEVIYDFKKAGFTIPLRYTLHDDALVASVDSGRIEQRDKYRIVNLSLLPFFGAGSVRDNGYLFVPDGSGALINFNNNKALYKSYNERVYGGDHALATPEQTNAKEDVRLPVFGLKNEDSAFLAVIHQGAYQAGITAEVSGKNNQYNSVFSYLNMTEFETNVLMEGSPNEKQVVRASASDAGHQPFELRYYFLSGAKANYSGMAERYRKYLVEDQGVKAISESAVKGIAPKTEQIPLLVDFLGGIKKRTTFLGIPYETVEPLTSFKDVSSAATQLQNNGINNLQIRYEGWLNGGMKDKIPVNVDAESKLGGNQGFKSLQNDLEQKGVAFYPAIDPVLYYKGGNGFYKFFDVSKSITRAPALLYKYSISTGVKNTLVQPWYLLKPESVKEGLERFSASAAKNGVKRIAMQTIGSTLYSDFRRDLLSKNGTGKLWEEGLKAASSQIKGIAFDHADAYTFPFAESISDVPLSASGFDSEDGSIPFYSMVVSGLIPAFSEPLNLSGNPEQYVLKLIETGTYPAYRFIGEDGSKLKGTDYDNLFSADFNQWKDDVYKQYQLINKALEPVRGQAIIHHEQIAKGVYRTTFANGKSILTNYTDKAVAIGQDRIESSGYLLQ